MWNVIGSNRFLDTTPDSDLQTLIAVGQTAGPPLSDAETHFEASLMAWIMEDGDDARRWEAAARIRLAWQRGEPDVGLFDLGLVAPRELLARPPTPVIPELALLGMDGSMAGPSTSGRVTRTRRLARFRLPDGYPWQEKLKEALTRLEVTPNATNVFRFSKMMAPDVIAARWLQALVRFPEFAQFLRRYPPRTHENGPSYEWRLKTLWPDHLPMQILARTLFFSGLRGRKPDTDTDKNTDKNTDNTQPTITERPGIR